MNIFNFQDYRVYLKSWLKEARQNKTFNLSKLALVAQVHPTFLANVLSGLKDLSLEQAALISRHLQHTKLEREYFFVLIQYDRAGNPELREYFEKRKQEIEQEKLKISHRINQTKELTSDQRVQFYSSWIYVAVWAATTIDDGQTLEQIAERFGISRIRAEEILNFLMEIQICAKKTSGTREVYHITENSVFVPNNSPHVVKHHTNWRLRALEKLDERTEDELFFTSPMSISKSDFGKIREELTVLIKNSLQTAVDSEPEDVVCLNIDLFKAVF